MVEERTPELEFAKLVYDDVLYLLANDKLRKRFRQIEAGRFKNVNIGIMGPLKRELGTLAQFGIIYWYMGGDIELTPIGKKISEDLKKHSLT